MPADPQLIATLIQWNKMHPIGTQIKFKDGDETLTSWTRSEAWIAPNGRAVILLVGRNGYIPFDDLVDEDLTD